MKNVKRVQRVVQIICALFSFLFVYTALSKLLQMENFIAVLSRIPFVKRAPVLVAYTVPVIELSIALMLFISGLEKTGLLFSAVLLAVFTLFILFMLVTQNHLPCSCGGVIGFMSWKQHFFFNLFCTLTALTAWKNAPLRNIQSSKTNFLFE